MESGRLDFERRFGGVGRLYGDSALSTLAAASGTVTVEDLAAAPAAVFVAPALVLTAADLGMCDDEGEPAS